MRSFVLSVKLLAQTIDFRAARRVKPSQTRHQVEHGLHRQLSTDYTGSWARTTQAVRHKNAIVSGCLGHPKWRLLGFTYSLLWAVCLFYVCRCHMSVQYFTVIWRKASSRELALCTWDTVTCDTGLGDNTMTITLLKMGLFRLLWTDFPTHHVSIAINLR